MRKKDNYYNKYENCEIVYCECGHSMHFYRNHSAICNWCGRMVYPSKKAEFKEKIGRKIRRIKNEKK